METETKITEEKNRMKRQITHTRFHLKRYINETFYAYNDSRKQIHKRFDTITINEFNTSKLCCDCSKELKHSKDKKNTDI